MTILFSHHRTAERISIDSRVSFVPATSWEVTTALTIAASAGHHLVDADVFPVDSIEPKTNFHSRSAPASSAATLTAKTPADLHGRVLTGVALGPPAQRFTPVALAIPTATAIEFDISWEGDEL